MSDAIKVIVLGEDLASPATTTNPLPVLLSEGSLTIGQVQLLGVNGTNLAVVDGLGNLTVIGQGPVAPGTAQAGSLLGGAVYTSGGITLTNGQQAALQLTSAGALITSGTFTGTVSSSANATAAAPSYSEGTENPFSQNLTGDLRTIAKISSGQTLATVTTVGAVTAITNALPAGSNTIGAITQASGPWTQNLTQIGGASIALGQAIMVASVPVAIASNQSAITVTGTAGTFPVTQSTSPWIIAGGGTAGAAATGVATIQGIASMTPVQVSQATAASLNATVVGTGTFAVQATLAPVSASAAGIAPVVSSALETGHVLKASAGNLYGLNVTTTTAAGMVLLFNSTTVPAAGTVAPVKAYQVPANSTLVIGFDPPEYFGTGISVAFSTATTPFTKTDSATAFFSGDVV